MIDVIKEFPNVKKHGGFSRPSYFEIVSKFGNIEIQTHDKDYQGDSFYLLKRGSEYGYLAISWGSCSGCDALQACESYEELQNLVSKLEVSIVWQESIEKMKDWVNARDWQGTAEWHAGATEFLKEFQEYPFRAFK